MPNVNNFSVTIMSYTEQECTDLKKLCDDRLKYVLFGRETCPTSGRPHLQGFICFVERMSKKGVLNVFKNIIGRDDGVTVKCCKGNATSNTFYCQKEKNVLIEYGQVPLNDASKANETNKRKYSEIIELAEEKSYKKLKEEYPSEYLRYHRTIMSMKKEYDITDLQEPCGKIYWGPSGCSKTYTARLKKPYTTKIYYEKHRDYNGEEVMLIDELKIEQVRPYYAKLMEWADCYSFDHDVKTLGVIRIRPKEFIVTTNMTPDEILGQVPLIHQEAFKRRFEFVEFNIKYIKN